MKRQVPLVLCFAFGIVMILTQFIPHASSQSLYTEVIGWALIITPLRAYLEFTHAHPNAPHTDSSSRRTLAVQYYRIRRKFW